LRTIFCCADALAATKTRIQTDMIDIVLMHIRLHELGSNAIAFQPPLLAATLNSQPLTIIL
jgi:hypothetical protein